MAASEAMAVPHIPVKWILAIFLGSIRLFEHIPQTAQQQKIHLSRSGARLW
jgi:hypothetical protein